jgi:peroxiredoxin Q/BCP
MKATPFSLPDQTGIVRSLSDYLGKWVLLYMYPKDNTPGCTKEACSFRDQITEFKQKNIVVIGISKDSVASHRKFSQKYSLPFPILSDPDHQIIDAYGAWGTKKFMGKEFEGVKRQSFLIDPQGNLVKTYLKVNPLSHSKEVLLDWESLNAK